MLEPIRQSSSGLWVGRTGGYVAIADSPQLCKELLYPNSFKNPTYIGMDELEALREYLNVEADAKREPMSDEEFDKLSTGDRVHINAIGTVIHVHGNGRVDTHWEGSPIENSVDRKLLALVEDKDL